MMPRSRDCVCQQHKFAPAKTHGDHGQTYSQAGRPLRCRSFAASGRILRFRGASANHQSLKQ